TMLLHSSGEWMKSNPLKMPALNSIQDVGGQITYLKRYSLSAMLGVSSEEDNDSNLASGNEFNYSNTENKKHKQQDIGRATLLAKFKQGGGTVDQFDTWYANQSAQGFDNNQMDAYLTKALVKKGKQWRSTLFQKLSTSAENQQENNVEHLARKRETSYLKITTGYAVFVIPPLPRFIMSCQKEVEKAGEFIQMDYLSATIVMMKYIEMAVS